MSTLLDEYLLARKVFCEKKLDLEDALENLIKERAHIEGDIYFDIKNWEDDHLVVFVSDCKFTDPRHLFLSREDIERRLCH